MEERALKRSFCWFIVLVLPLILILGVLPCAAEQTYTLQDLIANGTVIHIDNLEFSDFSIPPSLDLSNIDLSNISVETISEETLKPGLKFVVNGELSVTASSRTLIISYTVTHIGGDFIEGDSFTLAPLTISGNNALVRFQVETAYGQIGITKKILYQLKQNQSTQFSDGKLETPQAVLRPTVYLQAIAPASEEEASIDSFEQVFSLAPMIDAGDDRVVFDQVTLKPTGSPIGGECLWELYLKKDEDNLVPVGESKECEQATFSDLENGFYVAKLTVTNSGGVSSVDFVNIYAAGPPSGGGTEPEIPENAELNLWHFELKKYKYCKWSIARMLGTFDLPDDFEFNRGDDLVGKVTVQINRGEEPVVVMSDDLKLKVKNWRYKSVIHSH